MSDIESANIDNPKYDNTIDRREDLPAGMGLIVFVLGLGAGLMAAFFWADIFGESLNVILAIFVIALLVLGGLGIVFLLFRKRIIAHFFNVTQTRLSNFAEPLGDVAQFALMKDAEGATSAARRLVQLSLARYAWVATRRWIIASLTALIAAMAALGGTTVLYKQNVLLAKQSLLLTGQNTRLDEQNRLINLDINLAEASRNAELVVEISKIGGELATILAKSNLLPDNNDGNNIISIIPDPARDIDPGLLARIVATSLALRPYRYLQRLADRRDYGERLRTAVERRQDLPATLGRLKKIYGWSEKDNRTMLVSRAASPERGQLLAVILKSGVNKLEALNFLGLDLSYAKVEVESIFLGSFQQARLAFSDFSYTEIGGSDFGGAVLDNAWFKKSIIFDTSFASVSGDKILPPYKKTQQSAATLLAGVDFSGALIKNSQFDGVQMMAAKFDDAILSDVSFVGATIGTSTFRNTVLIDVDFTSAQLHSVDFDGAIVFEKDFIEKLANTSAANTFRPMRFVIEPIEMTEVYDHAAAYANIGGRINTEKIEGRQAYRIKRIAPFEK